MKRITKFSKKYIKKIYCIEGDWETDHRDQKSVRDALEFMKKVERIDYIYKQCHNKQDLNFLCKKSVGARYNSYSILYLAFHGSNDRLYIGERNNYIDLDTLANDLNGLASDKIIHFGSCSILRVHKSKIDRFLKNTGALAVSGYKKDTDFVEGTFMDMLFFSYCQMYKSIKSLKNKVEIEYSGLVRKLGFTIEFRKSY